MSNQGQHNDGVGLESVVVTGGSGGGAFRLGVTPNGSGSYHLEDDHQHHHQYLPDTTTGAGTTGSSSRTRHSQSPMEPNTTDPYAAHTSIRTPRLLSSEEGDTQSDVTSRSSGGHFATEEDEATTKANAEKRQRRERALRSNEVTHRILVILNEGDRVKNGLGQEYELKQFLAGVNTSHNVAVHFYAHVPPRSTLRYLMFQSPATVRGSVGSEFNNVCRAMKQSIAQYADSIGITRFMASVTIDCETQDPSASFNNVVKEFSPHLIFIGQRSDQGSISRLIWCTTQEVFVHQCARQSTNVVICNDPPTDDGGAGGGAVGNAFRQKRRTFVCCVNTGSLFGHLPPAALAAASMAKDGDQLHIFTAYSLPDVATAVYSTDIDWAEKVKSQMNATKDTVERVQNNLTRLYPNLDISVHISDDQLVTGLKKMVREKKPDLVVVGSGRQDAFAGQGILQAVSGHNADRIARALPESTIVVATPSSSRSGRRF